MQCDCDGVLAVNVHVAQYPQDNNRETIRVDDDLRQQLLND